MSPASSWIEAAARRGILTSHYPARPATDDEVPLSGHAPEPEPSRPVSLDAKSLCPVGAISDTALDQGLCVRCGRCLAAGVRFSGPAEQSRTARAELVEPFAPSGAAPASLASLRELGRSIHVFLVDVGSCNACNLEVLALANPFYDAARLGIFFTNSPRHADVLLVVGVPTDAMVEPLRRAYEALPAPKSVLAVGACPISGGAFRGNPGLTPALADVVPVDAFVPGCPPSPLQVLDGLLRLMGRARTPEAP